MIRYLAIGVLSLLVSVGAHAADLGGRSTLIPSAPASTVYPSGFWAGLAGGYSFANAKLTGDPQADFSTLGDRSMVGEVQGGYDASLGGRVFIGAFGGLNIGQGIVAGTGYDWGGVIGPRVGLSLTPDFKVYGAGGAAYGSFTDGARWGWFGETGVEQALGGNLSLKLFGRYTEFGGVDAADVSSTSSLAVMGGVVYRP